VDIGVQAVELVDKRGEILNEVAANSSPEIKRLYRAISEAMATIKAPLQEYYASSSAAFNAGGIEPEKITSTADIQQRLKLFERLEKANEKYKALCLIGRWGVWIIKTTTN